MNLEREPPLPQPFSGADLLGQIERRLHFVSELKRSEQLLAGEKEILKLIACGAEFGDTVEAGVGGSIGRPPASHQRTRDICKRC